MFSGRSMSPSGFRPTMSSDPQPRGRRLRAGVGGVPRPPDADPTRPHELSPERALRLARLHHLLAVRVERVVDDPLGGVQVVAVLVAEPPKALGHGLGSAC